MRQSAKSLLKKVEDAIGKLKLGEEPATLYDPIYYLMSLGGKRLRPLLTLLTYKIFKDDLTPALSPAVAVEVFHNFTLMHDDIMDNAPLRRGKPTVHEQWNVNIGILSGDAMLVRAYELLMEIPDEKLRKVLEAFNSCAIAVCEGQQIDMDFESIDLVSEGAYLEMIRKKTAELLGFSTWLGAYIGGANEADQEKLRDFGIQIGIGFQLMDDILDVYAEESRFGKQQGGDIISNKKTYLLIKALELAEGKTAKELNSWISKKKFDPKEKVEAVTRIYDQLEIRTLAEDRMNGFFEKGFRYLAKVNAAPFARGQLKHFAQGLVTREQ